MPSGLGGGGKRAKGGTSGGVAKHVANFESLSGAKKVNIAAAAASTRNDDSEEEARPLRSGTDSTPRARRNHDGPDYDDDTDIFEVRPLAVLHEDRTKLLSIVSGMVKEQVQRQVILSSDPFYNYVRKVAGCLMNAQSPDDLLHMVESRTHEKLLDSLRRLEEDLLPATAKHVASLHSNKDELEALKAKILDELAKMETEVRNDGDPDKAIKLNKTVGAHLRSLKEMDSHPVLQKSKMFRQSRPSVNRLRQQDRYISGWVFVLAFQHRTNKTVVEETFALTPSKKDVQSIEADEVSSRGADESSAWAYTSSFLAQDLNQTLIGKNKDNLVGQNMRTSAPMATGAAGRTLPKDTKFKLNDYNDKPVNSETHGGQAQKDANEWLEWFQAEFAKANPRVLKHFAYVTSPDEHKLSYKTSEKVRDEQTGKVYLVKSVRKNEKNALEDDKERIKELMGDNMDDRLMNMYRLNNADHKVSLMLRDTINTLSTHAIPYERNDQGIATLWAHPRPTVQFYTRPGNYDDRMFYLRPDLEVAAGKALEGVREAYNALEIQQTGSSRGDLVLETDRMWESDAVVDFASLTALYLNIQERMSAKRYYSTVDTQFRMMEINATRERLANTLLRAGNARDSSQRGQSEVLDWRICMRIDHDHTHSDLSNLLKNADKATQQKRRKTYKN